MIVAVDVGYGYTNYAYDGVLGKFPSTIANIPVITNFGENDTYSYNNTTYLVGDNAKFSNTIPTRTENFLIKYSPLLIYHLFKEQNIKKVDALCTSMSISEYRTKSQEIEKRCSNFIVNGESFSQKVFVFPQGLGIWVDASEPKNALIIDIGLNTLDILTVIDSKPSPEYSFSFTNKGIGIITDSINYWVNSNFTGNSISQERASEILKNNGKFKRFRKEYDISDFINKQKEIFAENTLAYIFSNSKLNDILPDIDNLILAGGGAYYIPKYIVDKFGVRISNEPEYANVRGFLKLIKNS
jgi:plasmid segregation protein ParM